MIIFPHDACHCNKMYFANYVNRKIEEMQIKTILKTLNKYWTKNSTNKR